MISTQELKLAQFFPHFSFKLERMQLYYSDDDIQWEINFLRKGLILFKEGLS
jgi:hypothetical protein